MDKHAVALVLEEIATLLEASGSNRFKARAFRTAARAVEKVEGELGFTVAAGDLGEIRGIGPVTGRVIEELVATGESAYHAELRERAPSGMRELLRVPGLGAKKIVQLHTELGIADLDALEDAARDGRVAGVRGFGELTQQRILDGLAFARSSTGRRRYHQALEAGDRIAGFIAALPGVQRAEIAGQLRRCDEIVDGIVIVAAVDGDVQQFADALQHTPGLKWEGSAAGTVSGRLADGLTVELRVTRPDSFGLALILATGSDAHIAALRTTAAERDFTIGDDALMTAAGPMAVPDEEAVYHALGMQYVPPELREYGDEVRQALHGGLPRLVELSDLRGCFHCHTTYSDGKASIQEMAEGAIAAGWRYLGIADHSMNAGYAGGLTPARLRQQHREIADWNERRGDELWLFSGTEADILRDGQLDYGAASDSVLEQLDYVIGSVHSLFRMPRAEMTRRMRRAVADPRLTMLGHATGRLLLMRDGYDVDLNAVIETAAANGAIIEINADPHRLDMSWQHWPLARQLGVRTAINPDAHSVQAMDKVRYGVGIARKAWLRAEDVLNTWSLEEVRHYLTERKPRGKEV
ncbi:DNA polymerase/3'-5' exonuclease PolX [soil metagenome]